MAENKVSILIEAKNTQQTKAALQQVGVGAKNMGTAFTATKGAVVGLSAAMRSLGLITIAYFSGRQIKGFISAYAEQEESVKRLTNAMIIQGTYTEDLQQKYVKFAKEVQKNTRYGDEAVMQLMQQLISVGDVAPEMMERAAQVAIDFASATGRDLNTAALTVGKAAAGFTGELSRYGIIIDQNIPITEKFRAALEAMEKQFGGMAAKDISTFSGRIEQMSNAFGDLKENIGQIIVEKLNLDYVVEYWKNVTDSLISKMGKAQELQSKKFVQKTQITIDQVQRAYEMNKQAIDQMMEEGFVIDDQSTEKTKKSFSDMMQSLKTNHKDTFNAMKNITEGTATSMAQAMEDSFFSVLEGGFKNLNESVASFGRAILKVVAHEAFTALVRLGFRAVGSALGTAGIFGGGSTTPTNAAGSSAPITHSGGTVPRRAHSGLAPDEVPMILQTGEQVLNRGEAASYRAEKSGRGSGTGQPTINIVQNITAMDTQDFMRRSRDIAQAVVSEIKRNGGIRGAIVNYV